MEQPMQERFRTREPAQFTIGEMMERAKAEIGAITDLPVLSVIRSGRSTDGGWTVELELLESAARMGDNDLLAAYEIHFDSFGEMSGINRLGRYHREDAGAR
ncbi:gas vesicle protein [Roseibacterium sp. SDUM158017]|uniref:gas vesicle protein GvpO n=1 Tax=Roseicyclus salinarum TaxID=3036773 RepID=UPI002414F797|nr:gas vesicle protein GvpO [Roseibacterium sp. SDUM158017]MDG4648424.1 gas vesicle protein [Roseibacterium sp. SDUM158017]